MTEVMIIDDQSTSRIILEELLGTVDSDINVQSFSSPIAALEWAQDHQPDLILTDYKMPDMNGVELIRRLRQLPRCADIPIIVITVVEDKSVRYQALESGATDVLNKPVDHHECRARCHNLLVMRKQSQIIRNRARWLEKQVAEATRLLRTRERESLLRLARASEYVEDPTGERLARVAEFSRLMALKIGMSEDECDVIEIAATLHDVGKVGVPDSLLLKPQELSPEEFAIVKTHTTLGHEILKDNTSPYLQVGAQVALCHHERFDGTGYPRRLKGEDIPVAARIVTVADVFDALTSNRAYQEAISLDKAVDYLNQEKGKVFDPACIDAFNSQLDRIAAFDQDNRLLQKAH